MKKDFFVLVPKVEVGLLQAGALSRLRLIEFAQTFDVFFLVLISDFLQPVAKSIDYRKKVCIFGQRP